MRRGLLIGIFVIVVAAAAGLLTTRPWDPRIDREKAEQLLEARLSNGIPYACSETEDPDGTVANGEIDVDYFCTAERQTGRSSETGFWFGTDSEGISTELVPAG